MRLLEQFIFEATLTAEQIKEKYYPTIPQNVFDTIVKAFPSNRNKLDEKAKWVLNRVRGNISKKGNVPNNTTINTLIQVAKNYSGETNILSTPLKEIYEKAKAERARPKESNVDEKKKDVRNVYVKKVGDWELYFPNSYEQMRDLGRETQWCVSADSDNGRENYKYYTSKSSKSLGESRRLVMLKNSKTGEKFLYYKKTGELRDKEDESYDKENFPDEVLEVLDLPYEKKDKKSEKSTKRFFNNYFELSSSGYISKPETAIKITPTNLQIERKNTLTIDRHGLVDRLVEYIKNKKPSLSKVLGTLEISRYDFSKLSLPFSSFPSEIDVLEINGSKNIPWEKIKKINSALEIFSCKIENFKKLSHIQFSGNSRLVIRDYNKAEVLSFSFEGCPNAYEVKILTPEATISSLKGVNSSTKKLSLMTNLESFEDCPSGMEEISLHARYHKLPKTLKGLEKLGSNAKIILEDSYTKEQDLLVRKIKMFNRGDRSPFVFNEETIDRSGGPRKLEDVRKEIMERKQKQREEEAGKSMDHLFGKKDT